MNGSSSPMPKAGLKGSISPVSMARALHSDVHMKQSRMVYGSPVITLAV